jgi:hypothetical protein
MLNLENAEMLCRLANWRHQIKQDQDAVADLPPDDERRAVVQHAAQQWAACSLALGIDPGDASWATLETLLLESLQEAGFTGKAGVR